MLRLPDRPILPNASLDAEPSMRRSPRASCLFLGLFPGLLLAAPIPALVSVARAVVNHVVISEFATRGPTAATDEFIELYNPTDNPINMSGWKLQYKSATGALWNDRATLPANATIPGRAFYLIANTSYLG